MRQIKKRIILLGLLSCWLLAGTGFGVTTVIYSEAFDSGRSLAELGFSGSNPPGWELNSSGYLQSMILDQRRLRMASILSPRFQADRNDGTVTVQWQAAFFAKKGVRDWDKDNGLKVSLTDEYGKPSYSLLFLPNFIRLPRQEEISPLLLLKGNSLLPLKLSYTKAEIATEQWLKFKMELNPPARSGGDGRIKVACDLGDGRGYVEYLNVADASYDRFAKVNFLTELGNGRHQNRVGIDNILVTGEVANGDLTPPVTVSDYPADNQWVNQPVVIHLTATDQESGVAHTYYTVNNGPETAGDTITLNEDGIFILAYWSVDNAGNREAAKTLTVKLDRTAPDLSAVTVPTPNANGWNNGAVTVTFTANDSLSGVASVTGPVPVAAEGAGQAVNGAALDNAGNKAELTVAVNIDPTAPVIYNLQPQGYLNTPRPAITAGFRDERSGVDPASVILRLDGKVIDNQLLMISDSGVTYIPAADLADGRHTAVLNLKDQAGNAAAGVQTIFTIDSAMPNLPPDPAAVAPTLDPTVVSDIKTATNFLYTGEHPIQTGVDPETIEAQRAAVIRGKVLDKDNQPLPGVRVTVLRHPEYGQTYTRADGMFDLAVNGGGYLTVRYERNGYLSAQRQVETSWQDYFYLSDVVMIRPDNRVTPVTANHSQIQVAHGSLITDERGQRRGTLIFPPGTRISGVSGDTVHVRVTEFTVGANGPQTMPAALPPTSGYTYCVDLSVDEADGVQFSQPVYYYVDNFLNFPVGGAVPTGYYDRAKGQWIPSANGRIVKLISVTDGLADVDVTGTGQAADASALSALGFTDSERQALAATYTVGQSLWRVPIQHFSPWDCNWPYGPPMGAEPPSQKVAQDDQCSQPSQCDGSIIEMQNQVLGETVPIVGTPFSLNYSSDRMPGYTPNNVIKIPLTDETLPPGLKRVTLEVSITGRKFTQSFPAQTNSVFSYVWDEKDGYGRYVKGQQNATVKIGYVYDAVYYEASSDFDKSFAQFGTGTPIFGNSSSLEITIWQTQQVMIRSSIDSSLGGWSLNIHHTYDPNGRVLYLGDGSHHEAKNINRTIVPFAGTGERGFSEDGSLAINAKLGGAIFGIVAAADGTIYFTDDTRIRSISSDGIIRTIAGNGNLGYSGDDGPAIEAELSGPMYITFGPDGSIYFVEAVGSRIRKVSPDGIITTIAGNGEYGYSGDGGPAIEAALGLSISGLAVGADGSVYVADTWNYRIRKISPDGLINTVMGIGEKGYTDYAGPGANAKLSWPMGIAVGTDGKVYCCDGNFVRCLTPDGMVSSFAGGDPYLDVINGVLARQLRVNPQDIVLAYDGNFYLIDNSGSMILRIEPDGIITVIAGNGKRGDVDESALATATSLDLPWTLAISRDGNIYFPDISQNKIYTITHPLSGFTGEELGIPSEDSTELYHFDANGRHLATMDSSTGKVKYTFEYDQNGLLIKITDMDGNITIIDRDGNGNPMAITGPFGQRTTFDVDYGGYLNRVTNPANETIRMAYDTNGLLVNYIDPKNGVHQFTYDDAGRLIKDEDPLGGYTGLERAETQNGYQVTAIKAKDNQNGYVTTYLTENLSTGQTRLVTQGCCGGATETLIGTDGTKKITQPDGKVILSQEGPDPRFGMQSPIVKSMTVKTPSGKTYTMTGSRTAILSDSADPFSLQTLTDTMTVNGKTYTTTYDAAVRQVTSVTPMGRQSVTTLDDKGRVIKTEVPGLAPVSFEYDERGRLFRIGEGTGSNARVSTIYYNSSGYVDYVLDPLQRRTSFEYDAAGRVTRQILPNGKAIGFGYDPNGNVTTLTPPDKGDHRFTYTPVDLAATYNPPNLAAGETKTQYGYNLAKQPRLVTRPDGKTIGFEYDTMGRLIELQVPEGDLTYAYDATTGQLKNIIAPDGGAISNGYDGELPTSVSWAGLIKGSVSVTYNSDFLVDSQSVNNGNKVSLQYNNDGQLTKIGDLTITYDATNGMFTGSSVGNISDTVVRRNEFGEIEEYRAGYGGSTLFGTRYTYDALGRIQTKTETVDGISHTYEYGYDVIGQLMDVKKDGVLVGHYEYDGNGNRIGYTGPNGTVYGSYDAQDRITQYGSSSYQYTANGELRSKVDSNGTTLYDYDVLGNLKDVTLADGTRIEYVVDGAGRRIGKKVNGNLVQGFLYQDDLKPVAELDGSGNVATRFVYGTSSVVPDYMVKGGVTYRIVSDHLGSPRVVINVSTGNVTQRLDYDEFGNVTLDTNSGFQPFGFAGGIYDPQTKLVRYGARDYDAESGRWTCKDDSFDGTNWYQYCYNDPVNLVDIEGYRPASIDVMERPAENASGGVGGGGAWPNVGPISGKISVGTGGSGRNYSIGRSYGSGPLRPVGQEHHPISTKIGRALERNPNTQGQFCQRDPRYTTPAANPEDHRGYQGWHRTLDEQVVEFIVRMRPKADEFIDWLRNLYKSNPDLKRRFPFGF